MAVNHSDIDAAFDGLEIVAERKPEKAGGVTVSQIPAMLVNLLKQETPKVLADKDYELILRVPVHGPEPLSEKATDAEKAAHKEATEEATAKAVVIAKQLALYAAGWGKGQTPKLYINKIPNRKDMPDYHARLGVKLWDDVPPENRPGRK